MRLFPQDATPTPRRSPQNSPTSFESEQEPRAVPTGLSFRAWLLALAAQSLILWWVIRSEITAKVFVSSWTLSMPGVLLLLALLLGNAVRRRRGLSQGEMLAVFIAVSGTITVVGYNGLQVLVAAMGTGPFLQSSANGWAAIMRHIPGWLYPADQEGLRGLFFGESTPPWADWLPSLVAWSSLVIALALGSLALAALLADGWIRKERLAFPLVSLPLEMTSGSPRPPEIFRNPLLWLGFTIPTVLNSLLALHYYFPGIPALQLKNSDLLQGAAPPLTVLQPVWVGLLPFVVGLAYLAPVDVSFSIWFFQALSKGERFLAFSLGYIDGTDAGGKEPYLNEQTVGAFLALGVVLLWRALPRKGRDAPSVTNRPLALVLVACLTLSLLYVLGFLIAAGFSWWLALELVVLYFLTAVVIARVRAEAGFAWAYGPDRFTASLSQIVVGAHGATGMAARDLSLLGFFHWLWWDMRFALLPSQMDALKLGDSAAIRRRQLLSLLTAATCVAVVVGLAFVVSDSYRFGRGTAKTYIGSSEGARQSLDMAMNWLRNGSFPKYDRLAAMGVGGAVTLALGALRQKFIWWPFHPIGYVMAGTATSSAFWFPYLLAWLAKGLVLRYGGMNLYRTTLPLVYGLILGDVASQTLWSLGATLLDAPVYQFVS